MARRTIATEVSLEGVGLHSGARATVRCRPAKAGQGVVFRRPDRDGSPEIAARLENVIGTERCTTLGRDETSISTVEHLLAAVYALGLDDLVVEVDGPELPILDGSFAPFLAALQQGGVVEQPGEPIVYRICAPFQISEGGASYVVSAAPALRLTTTIEWKHPLIGRQAGSYDVTPETFARELAPARTFGFAHEVDALRAKGLARGGSTDSAVILSDDGVVGTTLRWPDEFVRHKAGDVIGDLALLGGRLHGHIMADRPSHQGNVALVRALGRTARQEGGSVMDISRILEVLPHRYPFLLVDRIVEVEPSRRIVGLKNVTINEPFFQGHFPNHPIMPGVLIIETMAQVGGMLLLGALEQPETKVVYFMSLDKVKFRRPVRPGDQLRCECDVLQLRGRTCRMRGVAYVDGQIVAEAEMMAGVVDR